MRFFEFFQDPIYFRSWMGLHRHHGRQPVPAWPRARAHEAAARRALAPEPRSTRVDGAHDGAAALNVGAGLLREIDDVGFYTNLGAQRLAGTRRCFPYGDPLLTNTPGATYSPILYYSHLIYQVLLAPIPLNPPDPRPAFGVYVLPPMLASKLATISFHLLGVASLFIAARRAAGAQAAWGIAALYCSSAYVMGVGGEREMIGGMTFASHIAPAAVTMAGVCGADAADDCRGVAGDGDGDAVLAGVPLSGVARLLLAIDARREESL